MTNYCPLYFSNFRKISVPASTIDVESAASGSQKVIDGKWSILRNLKLNNLVMAFIGNGSHIVYTIGLQLTARYWLLVAVLIVQFVPHRKHTPSP
jgi:hypothetical protein